MKILTRPPTPSLRRSKSDRLLGARISYTADLNGIKVTPQVRVSWQHEYLESGQSIDSRLGGGAVPVFTVTGPNLGRDSALISTGVSVQISPAVSAYADYHSQFGRTNYSSHSFVVGAQISF
jgi:outer membrane autotransporter protein